MDIFQKTFADLKKRNKAAFMPFLVAGDPNFSASLKALKALSKKADMLEIGFPYSDPLADGPVIQEADTRALQVGISTNKIFLLIKKLRYEVKIPITVLVYANLIYQKGINNFYKQAKEAGIDAVLVPDLPLEESEEFIGAAQQNNICPIFLITHTTSIEKLNKIQKYSQGFLYLVSVLGVTGARQSFAKETYEFITKMKKHSKLPIAVGFGISKPEQIKKLKKAGADGIIVASALVKLIKSPRKMLNLAEELNNAC